MRSRLHSGRLLLFAIVVVGYSSLYDRFFAAFQLDRPFATIWIVTSIATWIIGDNIVGKIFVPGVRELMRIARPEKERIARAHFGCSALVSNAPAAGDHEIKL